MIMDGYRKGVNVGGWLSRNWKANGWIGNCCAPIWTKPRSSNPDIKFRSIAGSSGPSQSRIRSAG